MGQVFHGSARTTEVVRRAIQDRQESLKGVGQALWHQSEDARKMEEAELGRRSARENRSRRY